MSTTVTVDEYETQPGKREDGVMSPADASDQVVNCSVNHSISAAADTKDAELGVKSQASPAATTAVNTVVRYRPECRRWSNLERYLVVACVVLLLATIALAVITITFNVIRKGKTRFAHPCSRPLKSTHAHRPCSKIVKFLAREHGL